MQTFKASEVINDLVSPIPPTTIRLLREAPPLAPSVETPPVADNLSQASCMNLQRGKHVEKMTRLAIGKENTSTNKPQTGEWKTCCVYCLYIISGVVWYEDCLCLNSVFEAAIVRVPCEDLSNFNMLKKKLHCPLASIAFDLVRLG